AGNTAPRNTSLLKGTAVDLPTDAFIALKINVMYCLQWLIPVLLIPKHWLHPTFLIDQAIFMWFYVIGFFMERRPCYICSVIFFTAVALLCCSDRDACIFWPSCETVSNGEMCAYVRNNKQWLS
uniref:Bladder cancer-associated protein n=1 Tax=Parascaris univalens TaxID=6257 RepID=A0A915BG24_PARUN